MTLRPPQNQVDERSVPARKAVLAEESNDDLLSGALVVLAKTGHRMQRPCHLVASDVRVGSMQSQLSIEINRPPAEVFESTLKNVSAWSLICVEDEVLEEVPGGVGSSFRIVTEDRGQRMEFHGTVTEENPPVSYAVLMKGKQFDIEVWYHFEDLEERTRVTQRSKVRGKGIYKVMFLLLGWAMKKSSCKAQTAELESLKRYCESR